MTEEVARRLIDGVWVTNVEAQGGSGGGGITRVTSDDETVTITNPTGPVVDLSAGGGSQAENVRRLDLGVVDVSDLLTDSVVLYEPSEGEVVGPVYLRDVTPTDALGMVVVCSDGASVAENNLAGVKTTGGFSGVTIPESGHGFIRTATTPIVAGLTEDDFSQPAAGAWQANHHYVPDPVTRESLIVAAGHLWLTTDDGDSGGSVPDFAGNIGGSVVDNDLTWTDDGELPTEGSMHVYADVATPATP